MTLKVVDIYCGAGGLSEGFREARLHNALEPAYQIVFAIDKDPDCMITYRRNHFPNLPEDASKRIAPCGKVEANTNGAPGLTGAMLLEAAGVDQVDVVIGGPNCQGVSAAGLRNAGDPRNDMFGEYFRLVDELRPAWFVMENVPGLTHVNNREILRRIFQRATDLGYEVEGDMLLAADFGCAQYRYRLFVVGTNTGVPIRFPNPTHFPPTENQALLDVPPYETVRDAIGNLEHEPVAQESKGTEAHPLRFHNHVVPALTKENLSRIKAVREGKDWRTMPIGLMPDRLFHTRLSDQKGSYGRLSWDAPAFTITASAHNVSGGPFIHPSKDRPISAREAARLQGFDDDVIFTGELESTYRQIGNAVPPPLARAMAEMLLFCHHYPDRARDWGHGGRVTAQLVGGDGQFPVLTPRLSPVGTTVTLPRPAQRAHVVPTPSDEKYVEDAALRQPLPSQPRERLQREAALPRYMRSSRRARVILDYFEGKSLDELCKGGNVSEHSVKKWIEGFLRGGVDGWRAYHTPLHSIAANDAELLAGLESAVARVRQRDDVHLLTGEDQGSENHRPHMNSYVRVLKRRYANSSVSDLLALVEGRLQRRLGTVYVGDLLAMCEVVEQRYGAFPEFSTIPQPGAPAANHPFAESTATA